MLNFKWGSPGVVAMCIVVALELLAMAWLLGVATGISIGEAI